MDNNIMQHVRNSIAGVAAFAGTTNAQRHEEIEGGGGTAAISQSQQDGAGSLFDEWDKLDGAEAEEGIE